MRADCDGRGERAAHRAIEAAYNDEPHVPFHELVREEQRKMLHVVREDNNGRTAALSGSASFTKPANAAPTSKALQTSRYSATTS